MDIFTIGLMYTRRPMDMSFVSIVYNGHIVQSSRLLWPLYQLYCLLNTLKTEVQFLEQCLVLKQDLDLDQELDTVQVLKTRPRSWTLYNFH